MSFHENLIAYLQDTIVLGNSLFDYLIALIIFVFTLGVFEVLRFILSNKLINLERLNKNRVSRIILSTLEKYISFNLSLVLAFYFTINMISFPAVVDIMLKFVVLGLISWLVLKLGLNLLDAVIEYQRSIEDRNIHILEFFRLIIRGVLIIIVMLWFLTSLEVDVTSFIASLGILSLAIAFSLKEVLADIFASLVIFIDRPFEIGDAIKVEGEAGTIEKIGIRSTRIRSSNGHLIIASNRELTNKKIHNLKRMNERRVMMKIQIHQATPITLLERIPGIVKELISADDNLMFDKINLNYIGDYSYDYDLVYFVKTRDFKTHAAAKHNFLIHLLEAFESEDILLPYPTQTVILDE